jgi:hypothetical protein
MNPKMEINCYVTERCRNYLQSKEIGRLSHLFQVPFRYSIEESEENHGIIHTQYLITQSTFEKEAFRICNYINPSSLQKKAIKTNKEWETKDERTVKFSRFSWFRNSLSGK